MNKLVVPVALIVAGLGTLMTVAIVQGGIPELQAGDLASKDWGDRELKVHGLLASVESGQRPLRFTLKDKADATKLLTVVADVNKPDTFQLEYDVAVQGRYDSAAAVFHADKVFTKCPSKYEADEKAGIGSKKAYEERNGSAPAEQGAVAPGASPATAAPATAAGTVEDAPGGTGR